MAGLALQLPPPDDLVYPYADQLDILLNIILISG